MPKPDGNKFLYLMLNRRNGYIKIGISLRPEYREGTLQAEEPEVTLIAIANGGTLLERRMHREFSPRRLRGEWFYLLSSDFDFIENTCNLYVLEPLLYYQAKFGMDEAEASYHHEVVNKARDGYDSAESMSAALESYMDDVQPYFGGQL